MSDPFIPKKLGGLQLRNAFIKAATYEGMYDNGVPTEKLIQFHSDLAKGNVGLTIISYGAVSESAKTFKEQMKIDERSLPGLQKVVDVVHANGGKIGIQLTHCGYFSKNKNIAKPLAPSRVFNAYGFLSGMAFSKAMTEDDLDQIEKDFVLAARNVKKIGFDTIELHMGHGYLLSQFLSPVTNKRKDEYGGCIENRARFPMRIFDAIQQEVGTEFPLIVKLNLNDGLKNGFDHWDCIYVCKALAEKNCAAVVLSGGFTSKTPFYLMRGDVPLKGMIKNGSSLAEKITMALFGPLIVKKYAYSSTFFLEHALEVRKEVDVPLCYLGGIDSKKGIEDVTSKGFEFIAIARALIHDPAFIKKIKSGEIERSGCTHCNQCVVEMDRDGVRCVL